jgi:hypothetical protein
VRPSTHHPSGLPARTGATPTRSSSIAWAATHAEHSIALRMPDGVIGIDVDHYRKGNVDKRGGDWLAEYERRWGPLPPTWRSSARDLPSGIRFYRLPEGRYATKLGESIEIIQRHHRYAVVWPSPHTEVGADYRWYGPDGAVSATVPKPNELPELPEAWVTGLREGATEAGPPAAGCRPGADAAVRAAEPTTGVACTDVVDARTEALKQLADAEQGSRHDITIGRVHHLVHLGAAGHPGTGEALLTLRGVWEALTATEGRQDEFDRMLLTSARKAVHLAVNDRPVDRDPCFAVGVVPMAAPAPGDSRPGYDQPDPIEPPQELHPFEVIGAHEFNPPGQLDQTLADAVLQRTQPVLRFGTTPGCGCCAAPRSGRATRTSPGGRSRCSRTGCRTATRTPRRAATPATRPTGASGS